MTQLLSLRAKSYDVTIQMKSFCLYLHMVLFVIQNFTKMLLTKFGSERIKESQIQCIGSKCPLRERESTEKTLKRLSARQLGGSVFHF